MKIVRVETFLVGPRWLFCRIETDEGLVGWGEPVVEGRADTVRAAVHELADHIIGQDPLRIEDHWQVLSKGGFYRGGPVLSSAVAGIDQALWDIAGKNLGVPVHTLLGGHVRDRVRCYGWVGGDEPTELREGIQRQVEAGFTAVKLKVRPGEERAPIRAIRSAVGDTVSLMVDYNQSLSVTDALRRLPAIDEEGLHWIEEPVPAHDLAGTAGRRLRGSPHSGEARRRDPGCDRTRPGAITVAALSGLR